MITDGLDLTSSSAGFVGVGPDFNTNHELNSLSKASLNLQKEKFVHRRYLTYVRNPFMERVTMRASHCMFKILAIHQKFFSTTIG